MEQATAQLFFKAHCDRSPTNVALSSRQGSISYAELWHASARLAATLADSGLPQGSLIGCHGLSARDAIVLFFATLLHRSVFVPLSDRYSVAALEPFLRQVPIDCVMTSLSSESEWRASQPAPKILSGVTSTGSAHAARSDLSGTLALAEPATVIFTSGSTGQHKGVAHSLGNYYWSALGTNEYYGLQAADRWLMALPLHHVGGLIIPFRTLLGGATCLLVDEQEDLATAIERHRPEFMSLVPTQLSKLLRRGEPSTLAALRSAKAILVGGDRCPRWLQAEANELGIPISLTYGSTEATSQLAATKPLALPPTQSVGAVLPHRELSIDQGVVRFRGKTRFSGYWIDGRLHQPFDADGWFTTSDAAAWSDDGDLIVHGRTDDIFISGGENIAALEIERVLEILPHQGALLVVPKAHETYGAVPVLAAWSDDRPDVESILQCAKVLPPVKRPREIYWYKPRGDEASIKPSRRLLGALIEAYGQDRDSPLRLLYEYRT